MKSRNKGQIRIIEAFLALFIVFSALTISASLATTRRHTATEYSSVASAGLQALMQLDSDGSLSLYIEAGNWSKLRDALSLMLPTGVSFNLTIYDEEMRQINSETVSNGGFTSQEVAFVKYVCASRNPSFRYYTIHLHLTVAK